MNHPTTNQPIGSTMSNVPIELSGTEQPQSPLRFCKKCGTLKVAVECADYNEMTGEKMKREVCLVVGCEANCDFFRHEYKNCTWFGYTAKCKKCGYIPQDW